ncbi:MFS transporter [uncultured Paracoccus sp.]|uniref:MFS transporter n=1 Tax=uncultured Paracoccus sp. TaxID=189685 RepID=UPI0026379239|nr:MFS transporter [uncultured Paracoccus sp.]
MTAEQGGPFQRLRRVGPVAVVSIAQLFGTSLWFSANSAADGLMQDWGAGPRDIGLLTSAVQAGFIAGTLVISLGGLADRFRASLIFTVASICGALFNAGFAWLAQDVATGVAFRFLVGLSLAGIYPIGMKLIVSWEPARTGQALALLVAMLTLGTALPHLLRWSGGDLPWQWIVTASSVLALLGAGLIRALGDGPHIPIRPVRQPGSPRRPSILTAFRIPGYRAAAVGYFGHMWELYAFWTVVPLLLAGTGLSDRFPVAGQSGLSFAIIAVGALGCLIGGRLSRHIGSEKVALGALALSGVCGMLVALAWQAMLPGVLLILLLIWGAAVVADSPQFSALSAGSCPRDAVGGALAVQNAIGFAITMVAIGGETALFALVGPAAIWLLVPGPLIGLLGYAVASRGLDRPRA